MRSIDTNAHSTLWHSKETNNRGDTFEQFIFANDLAVRNNTDHYTFFNRRAQTIIDITMASIVVYNGEHYSMEGGNSVTGSDHLLISFNITISTTNEKLIRIYSKGDWTLFIPEIHGKKSEDIPLRENASSLNKAKEVLLRHHLGTQYITPSQKGEK